MDDRIVQGGGAADISSSIAVAKAADEVRSDPCAFGTKMTECSLAQYAVRAFTWTLDSIPLVPAENRGLSPIEILAKVKSRQMNEGQTTFGIDRLGEGDLCV